MPRTARASVGGICYHVLNRGNAGMRVFESDDDYDAFIKLMGEACARTAMRVLAYCLMPNHFHLALWPRADRDLSHWMQWLMTAHVRRYHRKRGSEGHVWQGRFKAFPVQQDAHLLTVLRYIERNPLRAGLVDDARDWRWSSALARVGAGRPEWLCAPPVPLPNTWLSYVNQPQSLAELDQVRRSVTRGAPFGDGDWMQGTAEALGLKSSVRPRGRPRKRP